MDCIDNGRTRRGPRVQPAQKASRSPSPPPPARPIGPGEAPNARRPLAQGTGDRPKGPAILPARPSGPGKTPNDMFRPNGPTNSSYGPVVCGTVGPLGRTVWWWDGPTRAYDPGWGNGWPLGPDDGPFEPENHDPPGRPAPRFVTDHGQTMREVPRPEGHLARATGYRPKGSAIPPARPSGPGKPHSTTCVGPTRQKFNVRAVRRTVGPLGRTGNAKVDVTVPNGT